MARRLKVFRTAIGFHDAYVAAPSRKAALAAWGAKADLFARGVAEEVDDAALAEEPLAKPGEVIRRSRGSAAEQIAALPPDAPKTKPAAKRQEREQPLAPRPSRAALDEAERRLTKANARHEAERDDLARREAALAKERRATEKAQDVDRARLERARDRERAVYDDALRVWRG